jgi:hypothetical protein
MTVQAAGDPYGGNSDAVLMVYCSCRADLVPPRDELGSATLIELERIYADHIAAAS